MSEGAPNQPQKPKEERRAVDREVLREEIFSQLVAIKVLEHFHEDLYDTSLSEEAVEEVVSTFEALTEENKRRVLAIPAQLRKIQFAKYAEKINKGELTPAGVVLDILEKSTKHGFSIGYHLSPRNIRPANDGTWVIKGTDKDHRHNDIPMAYYSHDYAHRYVRKPVQYLYVIRSEDGPTSSHYRDNDGSWGHAASLSIVDKIDMKELESEMQEEMTAQRAKE